MTQKELLSSLEKEYGINIDQLIQDISHYLPGFNGEKFKKAFRFAAKAHKDQFRKDNSPYIIHPLEAAKILLSLHVDEDTLIATILHDVVEDTDYTLQDIKAQFGENVAFLVGGVTKLTKMHYKDDMIKRQVESLKKLFLHTARDPRIILIKLADRLHNMRTLHHINNEEKRIRIAKETFEIFVPIANLLGIEELKTELEDLSFRFLFPHEYQLLSKRMNLIHKNNRQTLEETVKLIEEELKKEHIIATVYGRKKGLYSIFKKVKHYPDRLQNFHDFIALRILVSEKENCYQALGILHMLFKRKSHTFKDYISVPKMNGYQSLHTIVFGLHGLTTEFQIRTNQMHLEAEYGIAAHYFSNDPQQKALEADKRAYWAGKILEIGNEGNVDENFLEHLKDDILHDRIFVFTPRGDAIDLPKDATCIDFAYMVHTEVGHQAIKAEVNGEAVPITTRLHNGDTVHILISKLPKGPSRSWLAFSKTHTARNRIRDYFKNSSRDLKLKTGKNLLQKEFYRAGLGNIQYISKKSIKEFCKTHERCTSFEDILIALGEGALHAVDIVNYLYPKTYNSHNLHLFKTVASQNPAKNFKSIAIKIVSENTSSQLRKILIVMSDLHVHIVKTHASVNWKGELICKQTLLVKNYSQISQIFEYLEHIDGVKKVERLFWQRKLFFMTSYFLSVAFFIFYPFIVHFLNSFFRNSMNPFWATVLDSFGIGMLWLVVFSLKGLTRRSFPELHETKGFWAITSLLAVLALLSLIIEVNFFQHQSNIFVLLGLTLCFLIYLLKSYFSYRKNS